MTDEMRIVRVPPLTVSEAEWLASAAERGAGDTLINGAGRPLRDLGRTLRLAVIAANARDYRP